MRDYRDIGLGKSLIRMNAPMVTGGQRISGISFDNEYEVQSNRVHSSQVALGTLVSTVAAVTGAATASFASGSVLELTSTAGFIVPRQNEKFLGVAHVGIWQGTSLTTADQIYPKPGANVTVGRYVVQGDYDLNGWDRIENQWGGEIVDTTGTSSTIISFKVEWAYLNYLVGTA